MKHSERKEPSLEKRRAAVISHQDRCIEGADRWSDIVHFVMAGLEKVGSSGRKDGLEGQPRPNPMICHWFDCEQLSRRASAWRGSCAMTLGWRRCRNAGMMTAQLPKQQWKSLAIAVREPETRLLYQPQRLAIEMAATGKQSPDAVEALLPPP